VVDLGHVGQRGHAQFLRHGRHSLGRDGQIVAAVDGEVLCAEISGLEKIDPLIRVLKLL
jgi:hypothetical protein